MLLDDAEPERVLRSGRRVLEAIAGWVTALLESGHIISVDNGMVHITPDVAPDLRWCLEASYSDVEAVLADREAIAEIDWTAIKANIVQALRPMMLNRRRRRRKPRGAAPGARAHVTRARRR